MLIWRSVIGLFLEYYGYLSIHELMNCMKYDILSFMNKAPLILRIHISLYHKKLYCIQIRSYEHHNICLCELSKRQ